MLARTVRKTFFVYIVAGSGFLWGQNPSPSIYSQFSDPVGMRDGVTLAAKVFRPAGEGKYPVILIRTPCGTGGEQEEVIFFAQHGYAAVAQDTRGRFEEEDH
jgi:hypothetical protein